jgi:hypothetical protein
MDIINKIDKQLREWYALAPHLPYNGHLWFAQNVWWLVLIGVIIGGVGVLGLVLVALFGGIFLGVAVFLFSAKFGGFILLLAALAVAVSGISIVIAGLAIAPLKAQQKKGWTLLLIAMLLSTVLVTLADMIAGDGSAVIKDLLGAAVGLYFLYEIRAHFMNEKTVAADAAAIPKFVPPAEKAK